MKKLLLSALLFSAAGWLGAQSIERQVIGSAGSYASAGNIQLSWTLGETVVATGSSGSILLTQGFQQPDYNPTSIKPNDPVQGLVFYPNPTTGAVNYKFTLDQGNVMFRIYDGAGKEVYSMSSAATNGQISLENLAAGIYTIHVSGLERKFTHTARVTVVK